MNSKFRAVIFDLGGVLLDWNRQAVTDLSPSQIRTVVDSSHWDELNRGSLTLQEACGHFSEMLGVDVQIIQRSLDQGQQSLKVNTHMAQLVEALKASDENLQLIVMSNISREHFRCVQGIDLPWSLFNFIFASGIVGMKKPDLCFFQHVLDKIGIPPDQVVMVDDRVENITAARSMGIHGILVNSHSPIETVQVLKNMFFDPTSGTETCMENNTDNHVSIVEGKNWAIGENSFPLSSQAKIPS